MYVKIFFLMCVVTAKMSYFKWSVVILIHNEPFSIKFKTQQAVFQILFDIAALHYNSYALRQ